ncbi:MAG: ROK family protein [Ktedonobacteraceae bacterium]|nr:ROK family protein [Ktedonobacteraceae bacterium]
MQPIESVKIFISYAHADQKLRKKLQDHLSPLTHSGMITIWQDQEILAGANWDDHIRSRLKEADVVLLLVSPCFMASDYCWDSEVQKALEGHKAGTVQVIPIILKPVHWKDTPLGQLQALPTGGKPVTKWSNSDAAFEDVVRGIREVVAKLQTIWRNGPEDKWDAHEGNKLSGMQKRKGQIPNIHLSADSRCIIGVDIDRSHLTLLLTDSAANIIKEESLHSFDTSAGARVCLTRVADELQAFLENSGATWEQVAGIGLATPGPLTPDLRMVLSPSQKALSASQMPGWERIDIREYLEHRLKKKIPIYLDNDANMGALGESRYGAGRDIANLVYVKVGMGIGAGLILNGQLYHGTGSAGELGHLVVEEKGEVCNCGNQGCLETVAAEPAIVKDACEGLSLRASFPGSTQIPALAGRIDKVNIAEVIEAANNSDKASQAALKRAGAWIGRALGAVINLISPAMILVDGDVIRKTDFLFDALKDSAQESSLLAAWVGGVKITTCKLEKPVAIGAVANVIKSISNSYPRKRKR